MNELIISTILSYFVGIASGLRTDAILTSQKQKLAAQLRQQEQSQAAFDAVRPLSNDVRRACLELAAKYERIGGLPAELGLQFLLGDAAFQGDFVEWLQAGGIPEGDAVKARLLQKIEASMQAAGVSASQFALLRDEFFEALEKTVFADPLLANWRHKLSLQYLSQQVSELRRLNREAAGNYSPRFRFLLTHRRRAQGFREPLGAEADEATSLTMLWMPPGRFWMGSPEDEPERRSNEGPQHLVQLQGFFLSQTPITQAQWRQVADWKPNKGERAWNQKLNPNPSHFKGDQLPVESVNWEDAMEFCRRLSQRSGRRYTLPSEAQWEYACRAGTTTPFHFGSTISTKLANYTGQEAYVDGEQGDFRQQTTDVASFPANPWGLHDMHGNVWEWCADHWHGNYEGAPEDGNAWIDEEAKENKNSMNRRLLRGGSWVNLPGVCRSAFRDVILPGIRDDLIGFRVCCLPQD